MTIASEDDLPPLSERLIYTAGIRCPCGYGFAYDKKGVIYTESGSPFVMRPDQWECAGTLLWRAGELSDSERERVLHAMHDHPISFSDGPKGETREHTTREPNIPGEPA
jgi:hypothetical protein